MIPTESIIHKKYFMEEIKMKAKKILAILFVVIMMITMVAACADNDDPAQPPVATGDTEVPPAGDEDVTPAETGLEPITIVIATDTDGGLGEDSATNPHWPTPITAAIAEMTGITVEFRALGEEGFNVMLAGGDMPDILFTGGGVDMEQLVAAGQVIPLDGLLESNGQDILANSAQTVDMLRDTDFDAIYWIPTRTGPAASGAETAFAKVVRWDLYEAIGKPEITSPERWIEILEEMRELEPETETGRRTTGMGYMTWGDIWHYTLPTMFSMGFWETGDWAFVADVTTNEIMENYVDFNSPLWANMQMMFELNQRNLLDPDSFTQGPEELWEKAGDGMYMGGLIVWFFRYNELQDQDGIRGFVPVPSYLDAVNERGVSIGGERRLSISSNAEHPERAMDLINFFHSADGLRLLGSGVEGMHWDYIDGVPTLRPEIIPAINTPSIRDPIWGISVFDLVTGIQSFRHPDGYFANLFQEPEIIATTLTGWQRAMAEHFGANTPAEVFLNLVDSGQMRDFSQADTSIPSRMASRPDDIAFIRADVDEIVHRALPGLAFAANQEEFDSLRDQMIADIMAAGYQEYADWFIAEFNRVR